MSEMKLIMERWDGYLNEEFDACKGGFKVGDVLLATDMVKFGKLLSGVNLEKFITEKTKP